jgi:F0F1-type ATP synthase assembly protein I
MWDGKPKQEKVQVIMAAMIYFFIQGIFTGALIGLLIRSFFG